MTSAGAARRPRLMLIPDLEKVSTHALDRATLPNRADDWRWQDGRSLAGLDQAEDQ